MQHARRLIQSSLSLALFCFLIAALVLPTLASAHGDTSQTDSTSFSTMEQMEDQMMGDEQHERMEALMEQMHDGTLSEDEQQELIELMQDPQIGPGAMTMMMRYNQPYDRYGSGFMPHMWGFGMASIIAWITLGLFWILLLSGIFAIWKWLSKQK